MRAYSLDTINIVLSQWQVDKNEVRNLTAMRAYSLDTINIVLSQWQVDKNEV